MAKMTLLEMTQNILSSMNSDEVNSITDTVESEQVAEEIRTTFYELYTNRDFSELEGIINLEWTGDDNRPNTLQLPSSTVRLKWLKYLNVYSSNNDPKYQELKYLDPEEFVKRIVELSLSSYQTYTIVNLTKSSPVEYTIATDRAPQYYTIFNDEDDVLVFDAVDFTLESHLTGANSLAWGIKNPEFTLADSFVPNLPENLFPHFLAEAKSACFVNIKEVANSKEEQRARRQLVRSQYRLNLTNEQRRGTFYGTDYSRKR